MFRKRNTPVVEPPTELTEGDKKLKELENELENEEEDFDEILKSKSLNFAKQIEASFEPIQQKGKEKDSLERKKGDVEELTSISEKMEHIATSSLDRIKRQVDSYGIGVDEQFFSKQVRDLETKLNFLEEEIRKIKGQIEKKEQERGEMSEQKKIIDSLIDYNKLVRLYNKMKKEYDSLVPKTSIGYSKNLRPLFDKERDGIGEIEDITEETLPDNDTERKKLHEEMKKKKLPSIDKKTKEITDKFTKLKLLIDKFDAYYNAEIVLLSSYTENIKLKRKAEEYKQKKAYIEKVKGDLKETLNLDVLEEYNDDLPLVADFMGKLTILNANTKSVNEGIEENTQKFNKAKSELHGLKFVKKFDEEFKKNREYDGDVEYEGDVTGDLGNIIVLKGEINDFLKDSVTRLIVTSFINGIENSNIKDYRKEKNGNYYLIAYIYTLVYELGGDVGTLSGDVGTLGFEQVLLDITDEDKRKQNTIGALTIEEIKNLNVDNLQIDNLEDFRIGNFELLESKHVAFLENYKDKTVINGLLMNIFNGIVQGAIDDDEVFEELDNLPITIKPFYEKIIKTTAEREAEEAEEAEIKFTEDEFNYYLNERPYGDGDGDDLFTEMKNFKTNYTGEFVPGQEDILKELTKEIHVRALSQFVKPYIEKKKSIGQLPQRPGDENYITPDHYESFLAYFGDYIPPPLQDDSDFQDFQDYKNIINMDIPLTHITVLSEILKNIVDILNIQDSKTLYNFKVWFFKENSIRKDREGTNAFENTVWYKNHIANLENFLEDIIRERIEKLDNQAESQDSSQSGTYFGKRYTLPLIDPTKFQSPEIMDDCQPIIFLRKLLGTHFSEIVKGGSWKGKNDDEIGREEWEEEWKKGEGKIPESEILQTGEQICTTLKEYILNDNTNYTKKVKENQLPLKKAILLIFSPDINENTNGEACLAVSQELQKIINDKHFYKCRSSATGGSQKRRKDTRRKRKDTRKKLRKDTRRKRKDTRRKRKDTRRKRKDTRRKIRKDTRRKIRKDTRRKTRK